MIQIGLRFKKPSITGMRQPVCQMVFMVAELLIKKIENHTKNLKKFSSILSLNIELIIREFMKK